MDVFGETTPEYIDHSHQMLDELNQIRSGKIWAFFAQLGGIKTK
jgi:hypothetical protein